jgi:hypothetical protein
MKLSTTLTVAALLAALATGTYAQTASPTAPAPTAVPADSALILPTYPTPAPESKSTASHPRKAQTKAKKTSAKSKAPAATPAKTHAKSKTHAPAATGAHFAGTLIAVDRLAMTFTVENEKGSHVYHVTPNTRFSKGGKPAIFSDAVLGEEVTGTGGKAKDDTLNAATVNFGAHAKAHAKKQPAKPAKSGKSTKPTATHEPKTATH